MPVSTGAPETAGASRAKRCKHCEESGHRVDSGNLFWRIQLDQDLLDTIVAIYPEWFKDYNLGRTTGMADGASGSNHDTAATPPPTPHHPASAEETPAQRAAMDKNKESLKVKLMLRRPINQLVAQGIMPPLKTSPAFHEQRQKLERAKMGDLLKAKIQQRPDRQELVRQHILEADMSHIDPSLAERQRMLKKARLVDALNDQLSHRPGPLELIKKNILHTEEPIERAVKEGVIPFKATCEGQLTKPQHPNHYVTYDDDSQSSEGAGSPVQPVAPLPEVVTVALAIPTSVVVTSQPSYTTMTFADLCNSVARSISPPRPLAPAPSPASLGSTTSSLSPLSSVSSPPAPITPRPLPQPSPSPRDAPGKDKNRKKSKSKSQPKTRTIKFHEYKGPPNAHKTPPIASPVETSYEILLQQQQLFLQWQLEWQHKYPQIILPAAQKPSAAESSNFVAVQPVISAAPSPGLAQPATPMSPVEPQPQMLPKLSKLEDMKVSDLKAELKRRNLPVSGSKPQLIERLRPFTEPSHDVSMLDQSTSQHSIPLSHMGHIIMDIPGSVMSDESVSGASTEVAPLHHAVEASLEVDDESVAAMSPQQPVDDAVMDTDASPPTPASPQLGEDIVREQQRRIKELQRELHRSQLQLQQIRHNKEGSGPQLRLKTTSASLPSLDAKQQQKLMLQQHLQNKIQQQQLQMQLQQLQQLQTLQQQQQQQQQQRQQQHVAFQKQLQQQGVNAKASLAAFLQSQSQLIQVNNNNTKKNGVAIVLNPLNVKKSPVNGIVAGHQRTASLPNFFGSFVSQPPPATPPPAPQDPPPQYEEAAKQLKVKLEVPDVKPKAKNVKSQIVDDVLEILIKNGELPASAAQDPATPTTPGRSMPQGLIFTAPSSPPAPPPPPPPPLPHTTFSVTLPTAISLTTQPEPFTLSFTGADSLDFILGRAPDPAVDLKELGLDLETLDSMDFGQLDCGDLGTVKMEPVAMDVAEPSRDQLINQQPCELMDIEMPMEMDDSDWLESLMPSDNPPVDIAPTNYTYQQVDIDNYDPLLSNSQDPFDLFNIEDSEFKMAGDLNSALGWDKVDFAT